MTQWLKAGIVSAVIGAVSACSTLSPNTPPPTNATVSATRGAALTDAEIAAVVVAGNNADISYANIALAKDISDHVRHFAQMVVSDHTRANQAAVALATKLQITPADNEISIGLRESAAETNADLEKRSGADFEKAYIDNEVTYHKKILDAIDKVLIPSARNAELKQLLTIVRPAVQAHLKHATELQAQYLAK